MSELITKDAIEILLSEKKKADIAGKEKAHNLAINGKRRVVHNYAISRIICVFIIAARIEGPDDFRAVEVVVPPNPRPHGVKDNGRRIAIVRGFFRFEFVAKRFVFRGIFPGVRVEK